MKQAVRLFEFGTVERKIFTSGRVICFQGEAMAAYNPCGNLISLVAQSTGAEVWARAVDKNSDATIGIYDPFNMEIPFSAQATINPSYDQPINGPIEFQIPEQGQWELKELLANLTKANTTIGENGVDATIGGDDDCGEDECDPCDPENMFPGAYEDSHFAEWYDNVFASYHGCPPEGCDPGENERTTRACNPWKNMDCDELRNHKDNYLIGGVTGWETMQKYGFTEDYDDYKPGNDGDWAISILKYFHPENAEGWRKNYVSHLDAYENQDWRYTIAGLLVIDCLLEQKGCD